MWQPTLSRSSSAAEIAMRARTSVRKTWMFDFIEVSSTGWRVGMSFCRHVVSACGAKKASLQSNHAGPKTRSEFNLTLISMVPFLRLWGECGKRARMQSLACQDRCRVRRILSQTPGSSG